MEFRKLIFITTILIVIFIAIVIGSPNTSTGNETSTDAFIHILENIGTAQDAIDLAFYRYKYTTAKGSKDFCNDIEQHNTLFPIILHPNFQYQQLPAQGNENLVERDIQYQQPPAQQNENVVDLNLQYQQPLAQRNESVVIDPNLQYHQLPAYLIEHFVFDPSRQYQQPPAQTNENVFNPNVQYHQPLTYLNEHFVFDSNLQYHQPPAQRNDHHTIDLNLRLSGLPTRPVYSDEYLQDQPETSTSYKYDNKNLGFDLNELPQGD